MTNDPITSESKQLCAVMDTNIWRSEFLLKSPLGAALIYLLRRRSACIGMPEIVEREIKKHIVRAGVEAAGSIKDGFRTIEILLGSRPDYDLPSEEDFEKTVSARLEEMKEFLVRIPFTLQHAWAALDMVDLELPPNGPKNQQFKDSAIWQTVLELSQSYDVVFLTSDKGFFKDRDPKKGLAENLRADCRRISGQLQVYNEVRPCLEALQKDVPPLDQAQLATAIETQILPHLRALVADRGFAVGERVCSSVSAFATEKVDILALTFELIYRLSDITQPDGVVRDAATIRINGDSSYNSSWGVAEDIQIESEEFEWTNSEGKPGRNRYLYASAGNFGGTPHIRYKLRRAIQ